MYIYYKGENHQYPNKKAKFFGFYERDFEVNYHGKPEDKEEAFKDFMSDLLYQQCAELCMFGADPLQDKNKELDEYYALYFNPDLHLERYERE
jgi:hypothetical protein